MALNRTDEAMLIAERGRTRAFVDLLLERQGYINNAVSSRMASANTIASVDQITDIVNKQRASVLYYSLATGYLYAWLIVPSKGECQFKNFLIQFPGRLLITEISEILRIINCPGKLQVIPCIS